MNQTIDILSFLYLKNHSNTSPIELVSWNWNGNHPSGVASEIKAGDVTVVSHRGNEITKTGTESDPAVHIVRSGNDVVKRASELHVEHKGEQNGTSDKKPEEPKAEEKKTEESKPEEENTEEPKDKAEEKKEETNGDAVQAGDKRKADAPTEAEDATEEEAAADDAAPEPKKQKTTAAADAPATNGNKSRGRPKASEKKASAPKKEKKVPRVGTAVRKTRSQGTAANESL